MMYADDCRTSVTFSNFVKSISADVCVVKYQSKPIVDNKEIILNVDSAKTGYTIAVLINYSYTMAILTA